MIVSSKATSQTSTRRGGHPKGLYFVFDEDNELSIHEILGFKHVSDEFIRYDLNPTPAVSSAALVASSSSHNEAKDNTSPASKILKSLGGTWKCAPPPGGIVESNNQSHDATTIQDKIMNYVLPFTPRSTHREVFWLVFWHSFILIATTPFLAYQQTGLYVTVVGSLIIIADGVMYYRRAVGGTLASSH